MTVPIARHQRILVADYIEWRPFSQLVTPSPCFYHVLTKYAHNCTRQRDVARVVAARASQVHYKYEHDCARQRNVARVVATTAQHVLPTSHVLKTIAHDKRNVVRALATRAQHVHPTSHVLK